MDGGEPPTSPTKDATASPAPSRRDIVPERLAFGEASDGAVVPPRRKPRGKVLAVDDKVRDGAIKVITQLKKYSELAHPYYGVEASRLVPFVQAAGKSGDELNMFIGRLVQLINHQLEVRTDSRFTADERARLRATNMRLASIAGAIAGVTRGEKAVMHHEGRTLVADQARGIRNCVGVVLSMQGDKAAVVRDAREAQRWRDRVVVVTTTETLATVGRDFAMACLLTIRTLDRRVDGISDGPTKNNLMEITDNFRAAARELVSARQAQLLSELNTRPPSDPTRAALRASSLIDAVEASEKAFQVALDAVLDLARDVMPEGHDRTAELELLHRRCATTSSVPVFRGDLNASAPVMALPLDVAPATPPHIKPGPLAALMTISVTAATPMAQPTPSAIGINFPAEEPAQMVVVAASVPTSHAAPALPTIDENPPASPALDIGSPSHHTGGSPSRAATSRPVSMISAAGAAARKRVLSPSAFALDLASSSEWGSEREQEASSNSDKLALFEKLARCNSFYAATRLARMPFLNECSERIRTLRGCLTVARINLKDRKATHNERAAAAALINDLAQELVSQLRLLKMQTASRVEMAIEHVQNGVDTWEKGITDGNALDEIIDLLDGIVSEALTELGARLQQCPVDIMSNERTPTSSVLLDNPTPALRRAGDSNSSMDSMASPREMASPRDRGGSGGASPPLSPRASAIPASVLTAGRSRAASLSVTEAHIHSLAALERNSSRRNSAYEVRSRPTSTFESMDAKKDGGLMVSTSLPPNRSVMSMADDDDAFRSRSPNSEAITPAIPTAATSTASAAAAPHDVSEVTAAAAAVLTDSAPPATPSPAASAGASPPATAAAAPSAAANPSSPKETGWLEKKGAKMMDRFRKRFFVLTSTHLTYYHSELTDGEPSGAIKLVDAVLTPIEMAKEFRFQVASSDRTMVLRAATAADRDRWMYLIMTAVRKALSAPATKQAPLTLPPSMRDANSSGGSSPSMTPLREATPPTPLVLNPLPTSASVILPPVSQQTVWHGATTDLTATGATLGERDQIVRDMFMAEVHYLAGLETVVNSFLAPFRDRFVATNTVNELTLWSLFGNIQSVLWAQQAFHVELSERLMAWSPLQRIGELYVSNAPITRRLFTEQRPAQERARAAYDRLIVKHKDIASFFGATAGMHGNKDFFSLLAAPSHRLTKLSAALTALTKKTGSHPDNAYLAAAIKSLDDCVAAGNDAAREGRTRNVGRLESYLQSTPGRYLILEDALSVTPITSNGECTSGVLCNDVLAIGRFSRSSFHAEYELEVAALWVVLDITPTSDMIELYVGDDRIALYAGSGEACTIWRVLLTKAVEVSLAMNGKDSVERFVDEAVGGADGHA